MRKTFAIYAPDQSPPVIRGVKAWMWYLSFFRDQVAALTNFRRQYGPLVVLQTRMPMGMQIRNGLIVSGAELNRRVLSDLETFQSGGLVIRGPKQSALNRLRRGMIGSNGAEHREVRRVVSPLFYPRAIREYLPQMIDVVRQELDRWPVGEITDISERISRISLLVSAQNLLAGVSSDKTFPLAEMNAGLLKKSYELSVWMLPLNLPGTPYRRLLQYSEELERRLLEIIDEHEPQSDDSFHLLDRLIAYHRAHPEILRREDLAGQLFILFSASHETVAKAVTWTLFLLSQHPRIFAELHDEIQSRCGDEPPTMDQLESLPLLDAVTKETMRLIPPIAALPRRIRAAGELGGFSFRPRDFVLINSYATHRDPAVYPDPDQFRPERWFDSQPDSFAYLPFGAGPRTCIGKALGTAAINLLVAMIVQRFRLTMAPETRIDRAFQLTLAPRNGMSMHVAHQDGRFQTVGVTGNVHEMVDLTRSDATTRERILRLPSVAASERVRDAA